MEKLFYLAICISLLFVACNDDNGPTPPPVPTSVLNYSAEQTINACGNQIKGYIAGAADVNNDGIDDILTHHGGYLQQGLVCQYTDTYNGVDRFTDDYFSFGNHLYDGVNHSGVWEIDGNACGGFGFVSEYEWYGFENNCTPGTEVFYQNYQTTKFAVGDFDGDTMIEYAYAERGFGDATNNFGLYEIENLHRLTDVLGQNNNISNWDDYKINSAADLNNDGFDDFIYSKENTFGGLNIRFGSASGLGNEVQLIPIIASPTQNKLPLAYDFIDFDGDSDLDGIAVFQDHTIGFIENFGTATAADFMGTGTEPSIHDFDDVFTGLTLQLYNSVGVMDFDMDGNQN